MRACLSLLLFASILSLVGVAAAAPISRPAELRLTLHMGLSLYRYTGSGAIDYQCFPCDGPVLTAPASISVDEAAQSIQIASGLLTLTSPWLAVESGSTAIAAISISQLTLLSGTFSVGGAAGIAGEPPCPVAVGACVAQSGFGGNLGLQVGGGLTVLPNVIVLPLSVSAAGIGGPPAPTPATPTRDFAPWTVRTGRFASGTGTIARTGTVGTNRLSLVTPIYAPTIGGALALFGELEIEFTDGQGVPSFVSLVPEPAGIALLVLGVLGLVVLIE